MFPIVQWLPNSLSKYLFRLKLKTVSCLLVLLFKLNKQTNFQITTMFNNKLQKTIIQVLYLHTYNFLSKITHKCPVKSFLRKLLAFKIHIQCIMIKKIKKNQRAKTVYKTLKIYNFNRIFILTAYKSNKIFSHILLIKPNTF